MSLQAMWDFSKVECVCKREHTVSLSNAVIEKNATEKLPSFINEFGRKKAFLIADPNTFCAAGEKVCAVLEKAVSHIANTYFPRVILSPMRPPWEVQSCTLTRAAIL